MSTPKGFSERFGSAPTGIIADKDTYFNSKKQEFRDFYNEHLRNLDDARESISNIISILTKDLPSGRPKIISRIKDREESIKKFERKYRTNIEKSHKDYKIETHITDLIGIRIICLYEDDVPIVQRIIDENFNVIDTTDKTELLTSDSSKFGYRGLHLDARLNKKRLELPENQFLRDRQFEIQIRSIVQDGWSEIDHRLKYKKSIPEKLKRRVIRLAALFELADQEFSEIRKNTEILEMLISEGDDAALEATLSEDRHIDSFSFIGVMKKYFSHYNFENEPESESARKIDGFVEEIRHMDPQLTDSQFKQILEELLPKVRQYADEAYRNGRRMNPFTVVRHVLYAHSKKKFSDALFARQAEIFSDWLASIKAS
jgi:putative GTP pyrophosphokinase